MKDKLLKLINNHKIFIVITVIIFFLFIVPPIINLIVTIKSPIESLRFINSENESAWIGFYGSMIGGGITLGGLVLTIYEQNRKKEIELITKYFPTLSIDVFDNSDITDLCSSFIYPISNKHFTKDNIIFGDYVLRFNNIGECEVLFDKIEISSCYMHNINQKLELNNNIDIDLVINSDGTFKYFPPNEHYYFKIGISKISNDIIKELRSGNNSANLFTITTSLILNINGVANDINDPYQYFLTFDIDISLNEKNGYQTKIYNISFGR